MDYKKLLEQSYTEACDCQSCPPDTRIEFLASEIFDFTTYDGGLDKYFGAYAIDVIRAIHRNETFTYQELSEQNYILFIAMCNMPFFQNRLDWGTSIRGAWFDTKQPPIESCGWWMDGEQIGKIEFKSKKEWDSFIDALLEFASVAP